MPILKINTNVAKSKIPADFLKTSAQLIADLLGKPISYVVVQVNPDQMMAWAGVPEAPCGTAVLQSIGCLGKDENVKISEALSDHIEKHIGVKSNRLYIEFIDLKHANVGYMGTTFATM